VVTGFFGNLGETSVRRIEEAIAEGSFWMDFCLEYVGAPSAYAGISDVRYGSMFEKLPGAPDRFVYPRYEGKRLVLHFSKGAVDGLRALGLDSVEKSILFAAIACHAKAELEGCSFDEAVARQEQIRSYDKIRRRLRLYQKGDPQENGDTVLLPPEGGSPEGKAPTAGDRTAAEGHGAALSLPFDFPFDDSTVDEVSDEGIVFEDELPGLPGATEVRAELPPAEAIDVAPVRAGTPGTQEQQGDEHALSAEGGERARGEAKRYALLVGINRYVDPGFTSLKYAERDARQFGDELRVRCGFDVEVLCGEAATRDEMHRVLETGRLRPDGPRIGPQDLFLLFFAGHGQLLVPGERFALHCHDAQVNSAARSLPVGTIMDLLETNVAATQCVCILDACRNVAMAGARDAGAFDRAGSRDIDAAVGKAVSKRIQVLFSCREGERSWEDDRYRHGVVTHFLIEALRARDIERGLAFRDLVDDAVEQMATWRHSEYQVTQRPRIYGDAGRVMLVSRP
jgi:hypothetical protein